MTTQTVPTTGQARRRAVLAALALSVLALVFSACLIEEIRQRYAVEIVMDGQEWNDASLAAVADALSRLPPHIIQRLGNRYYGRLHLLSNSEAATTDGTQPFASPANFYSNFSRRNELVLLPNQGTRTVLHELGHAYQMREVPSNRYAWVFFQSEMREFMAATDWELLSTDAEVAAARSVAELSFSYDGPEIWQTLSNDDPVEDYANSFALYFYDAEELERLSPERFAFMRDHVARDAR